MADLMIVATIALVLLLVSGLPIFLVFLSVNAAIVLFQIGPSGYGMFVNSMLNTATTQALATIPLFILMGEVIFRAGAVERLFRSIQLVVGFIPEIFLFTILFSVKEINLKFLFPLEDLMSC